MTARIEIPSQRIAEFCQRNGIRRLALYGSVIRDDFTPQSDVDVLVEFLPGRTPGWEVVDMRDELMDMFGRDVDFKTPASLSHYYRQEVLDEAEEIYVAP